VAQPASAEGIFDRLAADSEIVAALGTYTFNPGTTDEEVRPAMRVFSSGQRLKQGTIVEGVEVSLLRFPLPDPQVLLTGETMLNPMWRIYVAQWNQGEGLLRAWEVTRRVIALLPGATCVPVQGLDTADEATDLGILDQFAIRWLDPEAHVVSPDALISP
jgi:hypothetical protein